VSDVTARKLPASNTVLNPAGWPQPRGYANGIKARGEMVFVGGMIGWDVKGVLPRGFVAQTKQWSRSLKRTRCWRSRRRR
jgi:enamine deaminase RidA (YjgF/YER057c/UK114 family)